MFNDSVPDCVRLLYSEADHPNKYKYQNIKSGSSVSDNASPIEVQSTIVPDITTAEVSQCVTQKGQEKNKLMQCPAQGDIVLQDRKCQKMKHAHVWPQEPKGYVLQASKPAIKCKKEHQQDQSVMLPHKPVTMVKKPGQATQKKVLKNKNFSNVDMQPQKPSYSVEQLKKQLQSTSIGTRSIKNKLFVRTSKVKKLNKLCMKVKRAHLPSAIIGGQ